MKIDTHPFLSNSEIILKHITHMSKISSNFKNQGTTKELSKIVKVYLMIFMKKQTKNYQKSQKVYYFDKVMSCFGNTVNVNKHDSCKSGTKMKSIF